MTRKIKPIIKKIKVEITGTSPLLMNKINLNAKRGWCGTDIFGKM